jgi:hypothetical protein
LQWTLATLICHCAGLGWASLASGLHCS